MKEIVFKNGKNKQTVAYIGAHTVNVWALI